MAAWLAAALAFAVASTLLLQRWLPRTATANPVRRLAQNSGFPIVAALANKALDLAFAIVALRVLGPADAGRYAWVGVVVGYLDIVLGFGLNTWLTREVARDRVGWRRDLARVLAARTLVWVALLVLALILAAALVALGIIGPAEGVALALLTLALAPGGAAAALTAVFQAHERMEYPAAITVQTTLLKIGLGLLALALGYSFVGLAGVALAVNIVTLAALLYLFRGALAAGDGADQTRVPEPTPRGATAGDQIGGSRLKEPLALLHAGSPFMVNNLLASLFFRVDTFLLRPMAGATAAGWYSAAYRVVDGLTLIPAYFTLALFPTLARQATGDRAGLARVYQRALKVLLSLGMPACAGILVLAEPLIGLFAGAQYLPESAWALAVLILFLPFSYVNGVTQYVLIALERQRFLMVAFGLATLFNFAGNLLLIPHLGYMAAALLTVASELVLLAPFWWAVSRELPAVSLWRAAWRPLVAAVAMGAAIAPLAAGPWLLAFPLGAAVYGVMLLRLGGVDAEDRKLLRRLRARE